MRLRRAFRKRRRRIKHSKRKRQRGKGWSEGWKQFKDSWNSGFFL